MKKPKASKREMVWAFMEEGFSQGYCGEYISSLAFKFMDIIEHRVKDEEE